MTKPPVTRSRQYATSDERVGITGNRTEKVDQASSPKSVVGSSRTVSLTRTVDTRVYQRPNQMLDGSIHDHYSQQTGHRQRRRGANRQRTLMNTILAERI